MRWLLALLPLLLAPLHAQEPLTTAAAVRALPQSEARKQLPVRLRGVVTLFRPPLAFLQDETGAVYFSPGNPFRAVIPSIVPGDLVEVEGVTDEGQFAPLVMSSRGLNEPVKITVLGKAALPEPVAFSLRDKMNLEQHNRYAKVRGVVREAGDWSPSSRGPVPVPLRLSFMLSTVDGEVRVAVSDSLPADLERVRAWIGQEVEVHGVRSAVATGERALSNVVIAAQSLAGVSLDQTVIAAAFAEPPRALRTIAQFQPDVSSARRVQVRGRVALAAPGVGVYLAGDEAEPLTGIFLSTTQRDLPPVGSAVAAVGFPKLERGGPALEDAVLRIAGAAAAVEPATVTAAQALSGKRHHLLVQLDATLTATASRTGRRVLSLVAEGVNFSAEYATAGTPKAPPIELGSRLRVTGICVNEFADERAPLPKAFSLLLRGLGDVRVLEGPEFWTTGRVAVAGAALLALLLAALAWATMLRRQVEQQTRIIGEKLQREAVSEERNRVARELHDTIEQNLAGVALQLDSATEALHEEPDAAADALGLAKNMLRHTRVEARRSVWDLRSQVLELEGLAGALRAIAESATARGGPAVRVEVTGEARELPAAVEFHLLRIAQEALANALKHAGAKTVVFSLEYLPAATRLRIADDGGGFPPEKLQQLNGAHFGIRGMQERVGKIGAALTVQATPGAGCVVEVNVPARTEAPTP